MRRLDPLERLHRALERNMRIRRRISSKRYGYRHTFPRSVRIVVCKGQLDVGGGNERDQWCGGSGVE